MTLRRLHRTVGKLHACAGGPRSPAVEGGCFAASRLRPAPRAPPVRAIELQSGGGWFVGLGADAPIWQHSSFRKNRERLLKEQVGPVAGEAADHRGGTTAAEQRPFLGGWAAATSVAVPRLSPACECSASLGTGCRGARGEEAGQGRSPRTATSPMAAHPWCPLGVSWQGHPALLSSWLTCPWTIVTTRWWIAG